MESVSIPEQTSSPEPQAQRVPSILIVDDELNVRSSLAAVLSAEFPECVVLTTASAEEALRILDREHPQLLITDLRLPRRSGLELLAQLKGMNAHVSSILITAYGNEALERQAHAVGCDAYFQKPFDVESFLAEVRQALTGVEETQIAFRIPVLIELLKDLERSKKNLVLRVRGEKENGFLFIEEGKIIHAQFGESLGPKALDRILRLAGGYLSPTAEAFPQEQSLSVNWSLLLMATQVSSSEKRQQLLGHAAAMHRSERSAETSSAPRERSSSRPRAVQRFLPGYSPTSSRRDGLRPPKVLNDLNESPPPMQPSNDDGPAPPELLARGIRHLKNKEYRLAQSCFSQALVLDPENSTAQTYLAATENFLKARRAH